MWDGGQADVPEMEGGGFNDRLNSVRAAVLGANDGIVSTASLVLGVAGATTDKSALVIAGIAGLVAGALSMGVGEYVSVSTQRDSERALLAYEQQELIDDPVDELEELAEMYVDKGLDRGLALEVARQLHEHDALAAHAETELHIDPDDLTSPWSAAVASTLSFALGALLPLLVIVVASAPLRVPMTVGAVAAALALTGWLSARFGFGSPGRAMARTVAGGLVAMGVTYVVGSLVGTQL